MTSDDISADAATAAAAADAAQPESIDAERRAAYWGARDPLQESEDSICVGGARFRKPFVEKPVFSEDHNIYVYYPKSSGGGSKRLFRKVRDRSSKFVPGVSTVRRDGSYIYEEFVSTDGMDIKVYTVGPDYAHAEARKAPTVDGRVMRMADGKEVRYQVILTQREKEIARKITQVFGQNICGFDLLRTDATSYVCDVNGFSFVKGSPKYYNDCAQIMYEMIQSHLHPVPMGLSRASRLVQDNDEMLGHEQGSMVVDSPGSERTELRCVLAVVRHGDRTPKQKVKVKTSHPLILALFAARDPKKQVKLKSAAEMQQFATIIHAIVAELDSRASTGAPVSDSVRSAYKEIQDSLEETEHFSGINRKVQIKPLRWNENDDSSEVNRSGETVTEALLIFKYGGQLTDFGFKQADWLGKVFRQNLYPPSARSGMSLHSSYEHDIKFYASDEGRVQMTAAVFARAFLELDEDEIIPILYALVWNDVRSNTLLEYSIAETSCYVEEKRHINDILNRDTDFSTKNTALSPAQVVAGGMTVQLLRNTGLGLIGNPRHRLDTLRAAVAHIVDELQKMVQEGGSGDGSGGDKTTSDDATSESTTETTPSEEEEERKKMVSSSGSAVGVVPSTQVRRALTLWKKLQRTFYDAATDRYDVTKVSDIADCSLFHMLHFRSIAPLARSVYEAVKPLAHWMVPNEYGITTATQTAIAQDVIRPLVNKLLTDLTQMRDERHLQILSRYYFTSESHVTTLYNLLAARLHTPIPGPRYQDYISHFVIKMYEKTWLPVNDAHRFIVEIWHSSGSNAANLQDPPGNMYNFVQPLMPVRLNMTLDDFVALMSDPPKECDSK